MSYEEEFDKIMRMKAGQSEVPFNEGDWQKASAMLDQRNAGQKVGALKWALPALFTVVAGLSLWYLVDTNNASNIQNDASAISQVQNTNEQAPVVSTEAEKVQTANASQEFVAPKHEAQDIVKTPETVASASNVKPTSEKQTDAINHSPALSAEGSPVSDDNNTINNGKIDSAEPTSGSNIGSETNKPGNVNGLPIAAAGFVPAQTSEREKDVVNAGENKSDNATPEAATTENTANASEKLNADFLLSKKDNLLSNLKDAEVLVLPFTLLKRYDDDYFHNTRHRQYLMLEGGGMYSFGWNASDGKDGAGADYFAGLKYGYYFSKKLSASLGAQIYSISNITQPFYYTQRKAYSFGYNSSYTSVTTDHMIYGAVPLHLNYHFTKFSTVGAGINVGYLLQSHSRIDTYGVSDGVKGTTTSIGNHTIYDPTSTINMMGSVLVATRVHPRIGLSAEFIYGFTDLFENTKNVSNTEKPIGIRLGLNYYIFEK